MKKVPIALISNRDEGGRLPHVPQPLGGSSGLPCRACRYAVWLIALVAPSTLAVGGESESSEIVDISSLSGYVYVDTNFDGVRDPVNEWVLPDIEITLSRSEDPQQIYATLTGPDGKYSFSDLGPGTYTIVQPEIPDGYLSVVPNLGGLFDIDSGDPLPNAGQVINYDQQNAIPPQIAGIGIPETGAIGLNYNFGQIWWGKWWEISPGNPGTPPGGKPPHGVPEPSTALLLTAGLLFLIRSRRAVG